MDRFGLQDQCSLVKRKGWVHIEVNGKSFAFHRKKMSRLMEGKFIDSLHYFVRIEGTAQQAVDDFREVVHKLGEWLGE